MFPLKDLNVKIRRAAKNELSWINEKYDEIHFQHASFENEIIAIAEIENQRIGMGRLIILDADNLELGGIYVFDSFRKKGIVGKIIEFLMGFRSGNQNVYCIPFSKLTRFYERFGFNICKTGKQIPKAILDKCQWCEKSHQAVFDPLVFSD